MQKDGWCGTLPTGSKYADLLVSFNLSTGTYYLLGNCPSTRDEWHETMRNAKS